MSPGKSTSPELTTKVVDRDRICDFLFDTLAINSVTDVSCNGLQVEGAAQVKRIGCAVDACMSTFRLAIEQRCEMLVVHHGIIWGGLTEISGSVRSRIQYLIQHNLNLFAVHLPLDLHATLGNNAQLAALLSLSSIRPFGMYKGNIIGCEGNAAPRTTRDNIVDKLCRSLDTSCTVLPFGEKLVRRIAIVSGGGADELDEAIEKGVDCFITGEPSHENYHAALEAGINVIYAGHYNTEKGGVQAIGKLLEKRFRVETLFLDVPTGL